MSEEGRDGSMRISRVYFLDVYLDGSQTVAFLGRDNVMEVALGLIIGAAFSSLVNSLVSDIILPPISLLSSNSRNLQSHFFILRKGETPDAIYNTIEQAAADGKITNCLVQFLIFTGAIYMAWGLFVQKVSHSRWGLY